MKKIISGLLFFFCSFVLLSQVNKVPPGVVVKHVPRSDSLYIGSPSLCVLPNGDYIASHDFFGPKANTGKSGTTLVYRSSDKGTTWNQIAKIEGQYWSNIFYFEKALYILGVNHGHGNIIIRRSLDNGVTWTNPKDSKSGLLFVGAYHTAPTLVAIHNGKIWRGFENADAVISKLPARYGALMISADIKGDLLDANNWSMTNTLVSNPRYMDGKFLGWLEGQALVTKDNTLVNVIRVHIHPGTHERAAIINTTCDGKNIYFQPNANFIDFAGGAKKFTIRYDEKTNHYWALVNNIPEGYESAYPASVRNYLSLASSPDLYNWTLHETVLSHPDRLKHGFQYVDWTFEGNDIIFLSRTAYDDDFGGANGYHDANYLTFHRIKNYKDQLER